MDKVDKCLLIFSMVGVVILLSFEIAMYITGIGEYSVFRMAVNCFNLFIGVFLLIKDR